MSYLNKKILNGMIRRINYFNSKYSLKIDSKLKHKYLTWNLRVSQKAINNIYVKQNIAEIGNKVFKLRHVLRKNIKI